MPNQESKIDQIKTAQKALGKSVASMLEAKDRIDIDEEAYKEIGRQLVEYTQRLQQGIPRAVPFQLFKIAPGNADTPSADDHRIMIVIDDGQPGDVGLPGETTQCPRCGYHF